MTQTQSPEALAKLLEEAGRRLTTFKVRLHYSRGAFVSALQEAYPGDPNMYVEAVDAICRDLRALLSARQDNERLRGALNKAHGVHLSNGTITLDFHEDEDAAAVWNLLDSMRYGEEPAR